jgi:hypothetical protein
MHIRPRFFALLTFLFSEVVSAQWWRDDLNPYQVSPSGGVSGTVLLFAAAHAVPILVIAHKTDSKFLTSLAAIAMGVFAVAIGGGAYAIADLFFVAVGTILGIGICKKEPKRQTVPSTLPPPKEQPTTTLDERRAELIRLAESDDAKSQLALGELLLDGETGQFWDVWFPRDIERGLYWIKKAIATGEGDIHFICLFFYDELTDSVTIDAKLLDQFADAVSFVIEYDDNIENRTIYRGLVAAQQALAAGDTSGAYKLVSNLRSDYFAKHVKGG